MASPSDWARFAEAHHLAPSPTGHAELTVYHRVGGAIEGVPVDAMIFTAPGMSGEPVAYTRFTATAMAPRKGVCTIRCGAIPVYVQGRRRVITGDATFDRAHLVTASDPAAAAALLDDHARLALRHFAAHREFWLVDEAGTVKLQWRDAAPVAEILDGATRIVLALCRLRADTPYR